MRIILLVAMLGLAIPAQARRPVSLLPFENDIRFSPDQPHVLGAEHPLYRRILLEEVQNMPARVGSIFTPVTGPAEYNEALRRTLASAQMLAPASGDAKARLRVTWRQFDLPFHIGFGSTATVAINYELSRIDNGQVIFSREILTRASARGGNAATRAQGTGRAAILAKSPRRPSVSKRRPSVSRPPTVPSIRWEASAHRSQSQFRLTFEAGDRVTTGSFLQSGR